MSIKLQNDLNYAMSILNGECKDQFRKVFTNTNENLLPLFSSLDLTDKNVLAVLSSSDYLYMSYLFGARNVDSFDINPLTYRFFFLRRWLINNGIIDIGFSTYEEVLKVLESAKVGSEDEKESLLFWKEIFIKVGENYFHHSPLFITVFNPFNNFYNDKMDELSRRISPLNPTFHRIDIARESALDLRSQYDYIFLSNIIDYNRDAARLEVLIQNLTHLTANQGRVVCAHIPGYVKEDSSRDLALEKELFQESFEYSAIPFNEYDKIKYYQYTKK